MGLWQRADDLLRAMSHRSWCRRKFLWPLPRPAKLLQRSVIGVADDLPAGQHLAAPVSAVSDRAGVAIVFLPGDRFFVRSSLRAPWAHALGMLGGSIFGSTMCLTWFVLRRCSGRGKRFRLGARHG